MDSSQTVTTVNYQQFTDCVSILWHDMPMLDKCGTKSHRIGHLSRKRKLTRTYLHTNKEKDIRDDLIVQALMSSLQVYVAIE